MAQFTTKDSTVLTSSMWPASLPKYVKGDYNVASLYATGHLVPTHEDALRAWCFVATNTDDHDKSRNKMLAYCRSGEDELREVALRFQGFVKQAELGTYGTWDGKRENAVKAVQALTIGGGCSRDVFAIQVDTANMIRRYVVEELRGQFTNSKSTITQLEFSNTVFTKVTTTNGQPYEAPPDLSRNLTLQASKIQQEWRVIGGVRIGVQEQNGVRPATGREIRRGDFVDVTATLNIRQRRRFNATTTYVTLKPVRVVRLATATLVKELQLSVSSQVQKHDVDNDLTTKHSASITRKVVPADDEL